MAKKRQSGFEVLRIIAMFFVVACHYVSKSQMDFGSGLSVNRIFSQMLLLGGWGNNLFILISAYFLINSKFNVQRVWKLTLQVTFYTLLFFAVFHFTGLMNAADLKIELLHALFPIIYGEYWFITEYIYLYLFSPFINRMLSGLKQAEWRLLIALSLSIGSLMLTVIHTNISNTAWFFIMYITGAYFGKYAQDARNRSRMWKKTFCISSLLYVLVYITEDLLDTRWPDMVLYEDRMGDMCNFLIMLSSLSLFCIFIGVDIGEKKVINFISSLTFGVYLIHNNGYINDYLWTRWLEGGEKIHNPRFPLYSILCIVSVFAICAVIDAMRMYLIEKPLSKQITLLSDKTEQILEHIRKKICMDIKND